jgi:hypothetical protein
MSVETSFDEMCLAILRCVRELLVKGDLQISKSLKTVVDKQLLPN